MPEVIIQCPQCNRQLRVPEEMIGRLVKCPTCGMTFTLTAGSSQPLPNAPPVAVASGPVVGPGVPAYDPQAVFPPGAPNPLRIPAICLLVLGMLGLLYNLAGVANALTMDPQKMLLPDFLTEDQKEFVKAAAAGPGAATFLGVLAFSSLLTCLGAMGMLANRFYGVAILGSLLAMVNFGGCCCILSFPFGIWALVLLLRPEVKALFE